MDTTTSRRAELAKRLHPAIYSRSSGSFIDDKLVNRSHLVIVQKDFWALTLASYKDTIFGSDISPKRGSSKSL